MSIADEETPGGLTPGWDRLERAAEALALSTKRWAERALDAEAEVVRLRRSLEELARSDSGSDDLTVEVKRLRAENSALRSRMLQARTRISSLMQRLSALGIDDE